MRDAFGGAFLIKVMLIFLGIYVAFMAVALNYAKAFKVKNYIINVIEQYEGVSEEAYNTVNNYINGIHTDFSLRYYNTNIYDAHRYWRVYSTSNNGHASVSSIVELQFYGR